MLDLRSPYLAPPPPRPPRSSRKALLWSWSVFLVTALLLIWGARLVALRALGPNHLFYHLHDTVYLWLKGHFYTYHHPWSLVRLGSGATVLALLAFSLLSGRSVVTRPYIWLARQAVQRCPTRVLLFLARHFKRSLTKSDHAALLLVAEAHRERAALAFSQLEPQGRRLACGPLVRLTVRQIQLATLPPVRPADILSGAASWLQTAARLELALAGAPGDRRLVRQAEELASLAEAVVPPDLARLDQRSWRAAAARHPFDPLQLNLDLLHVAGRWHEQIARAVVAFGADRILRAEEVPAPEEVQRVVWRRLGTSLAARRRLLELIAGAAEWKRFHPTGWRLTTLPELDHPAPEAGAMSLELALILAAGGGGFSLLMGFMEAIESFHFSRSLWFPKPASDREGGGADKAVAGLEQVLAGLPRAEDYCFAAELQEAELRDQKQSWDLAGLRPGAFLGPHDFIHASSRVRALGLAGGMRVPPPPDRRPDQAP